MLFDCVALFIGLLASYLGSQHSMLMMVMNDNSHNHSSRSRSSSRGSSISVSRDRQMDRFKYSFGAERIKVMAGFINAVFLVYVGFSVLIEAFERILHPHHIRTDQLLLVSVLGLLVNLVGLYFFHDAQLILEYLYFGI